MPKMKSQVVVEGELSEVDMIGDKKDLPLVRVDYMGGSVAFFAEPDLYSQCVGRKIGDPVKVQFEIEVDPNSKGGNKFKTRKGSPRVADAKSG